MKSECIVTSQYGMGGLSPGVAEEIDALPETGAVAAVAVLRCRGRRHDHELRRSSPPGSRRASSFDLRSGAVSSMGPTDVAVRATNAEHEHLQLGDTVKMSFPETGDQRFTVVAIYGTREPLGDYTSPGRRSTRTSPPTSTTTSSCRALRGCPPSGPARRSTGC